jgi:DNA-binding transcriptional ArsR family regulator
MFEFMTAIKAVGDSNRVRILCVLQGRELCACQIIKMLNLAPSTVSKHLSILRQARLVEDRKEGRWMHYRLPDTPNALTKHLLNLIQDSLTSENQIGDDQEMMAGILKMSKEDLCKVC